MARMLHVLSYDISDARRRRRLSRNLEGIGRRVQESVFETYMTPGQIRKVMSENLVHICPLEGESLRIYRICAHCAEYFRHVGGVRIEWGEDIVF